MQGYSNKIYSNQIHWYVMLVLQCNSILLYLFMQFSLYLSCEQSSYLSVFLVDSVKVYYIVYVFPQNIPSTFLFPFILSLKYSKEFTLICSLKSLWYNKVSTMSLCRGTLLDWGDNKMMLKTLYDSFVRKVILVNVSRTECNSWMSSERRTFGNFLFYVKKL